MPRSLITENENMDDTLVSVIREGEISHIYAYFFNTQFLPEHTSVSSHREGTKYRTFGFEQFSMVTLTVC